MKLSLIFTQFFPDKRPIRVALLRDRPAPLHSLNNYLALFLVRVLAFQLFQFLIVLLGALAVRIRVYLHHLIEHIFQRLRIDNIFWFSCCLGWSFFGSRGIGIFFYERKFFCLLIFLRGWLLLKFFHFFKKPSLILLRDVFRVILQIVLNIGFKLLFFWRLIVLFVENVVLVVYESCLVPDNPSIFQQFHYSSHFPNNNNNKFVGLIYSLSISKVNCLSSKYML